MISTEFPRMEAGKEPRGQFWVDGQFTARIRSLGASPSSRIARIRRPYALIGSHPNADLRIEDPAVAPRHALLLLDHRGIFGVDLLSATGTRFAGAEVGSAWLGAGDILEVAGRRIEILRLLIDGRPIDPPLCSDDLLAADPRGGLSAITLEPLDVHGPPWMLGSALAFLGRGAACAIRVENASASETHCVIFRGPGEAHLIDLLGRRTLINDRPVEGSSALLDGDVLAIGDARFGIRVEPDDGPKAAQGELVRRDGRDLVAYLIDAVRQGTESPSGEILEAIHQLRSDTASLLGAQIDRIEALNREIAALRDEIRVGSRPPSRPAAPPLRLDLQVPPPKPPSAESATWILDRLKGLEAESRTTWKDLVGKIAATVHPRPAADPTSNTLPAPIGTPSDPPR